jgi:hypothetical protein
MIRDQWSKTVSIYSSTLSGLQEMAIIFYYWKDSNFADIMLNFQKMFDFIT